MAHEKNINFFWINEDPAYIFAMDLTLLIKKGRGSWPKEALATPTAHSVVRRCYFHLPPTGRRKISQSKFPIQYDRTTHLAVGFFLPIRVQYHIGPEGYRLALFFGSKFFYINRLAGNRRKEGTMMGNNYLPIKEKSGGQSVEGSFFEKKIWSFPTIPTNFVGLLIHLCTQQHISFLHKQPLLAVVVVCRKAYHIILPRMGAGPTYSGYSLSFFKFFFLPMAVYFSLLNLLYEQSSF
jgi:hypothetical protein